MALPTYNKNNRRKTFQQLPKAAYVLKILGAWEEPNKNGSGSHLTIIFDIAEGEYAGIYNNQYESNTNEDKKWPNDATFRLNIPSDGCEEWVWTNWNSFFANLEDSNNGFVFAGDIKTLKGKLIGGKMRIEQSTYNGQVYDHIRLYWTCVADDVRNGKAGKLPNDKLVKAGSIPVSATVPDGMMSIPDGAEEEIPF